VRTRDRTDPDPPRVGHTPDGGDLILPTPAVTPRRGGLPILASLAPIAGAIMIWAVTGHVLALWLAALGPLIAVASFLDHLRTVRRDRKAFETRSRTAREEVRLRMRARHDTERALAWRRHPDLARLTRGDDEVWRRSAAREAVLVVGRGDMPSAVRITGGGDSAEESELRAESGRLTDVPVTIPLEGGIAVGGPPMLAAAVVRTLALQLCLIHPPGRLHLATGASDEHGWAHGLPHRGDAERVVAVLAPGETARADATFVIARVDETVPPPFACTVRLAVRSPARALFDDGAGHRVVVPELFDLSQCVDIVSVLAQRARQMPEAAQPVPVDLGRLLDRDPTRPPGALTAVFATLDGSGLPIDLVEDGPHAVVAGMTGSGKSELLLSWITALCARHDTSEVVFLLADFKGGTAFDALAGLAHVAGVITDLDGDGADRAIRSLRAEIRFREGELARCGARDVSDERVRVPRLVIVVDEFAALLGEHPELHTVFTDIAARGRALGMHLVLGTQRIAGVVREALLANCPLRISLRVSDRGDSRAVIGTEDAARLPGGRDGAGIAMVRRAADATPQRVRVALSSSAVIARVADRDAGPAPRRIWSPPLPERVALDDAPLAAEAGAPGRGELTLGLADLPAQQRQCRATVGFGDRSLLVLGRAGCGRTTAATLLASQADRAEWLGPDRERAWDDLLRIASDPPPRGTVIVIDDADALIGRLPADYAAEAVAHLEALVRDAAHHGHLVVLTARRLSGPLARAAELFSRRLVLATSGRGEHVTLGGDPSDYLPEPPPGRGTLDGTRVQVALGPTPTPPVRSSPDLWRPPRGVSGVVAPHGPGVRSAMSRWRDDGVRVLMVDEAGSQPAETEADRTVLVGDPERWQRNWRTLAEIRGEHDLVIEASCAAEFRTLTGDRTLPPLCEPGAARAWLLRCGGPPRRVTLSDPEGHPA